jgi:glycosyltransferase involved in cell wall biosynthesis
MLDATKKIEKMEKKILSIGMPTYNRPEMIRQQVNEITKFINEFNLGNLLEIIVVDNCSEHDIYKILEPYLINKFLKVFRNEYNIGMSKNIIKTIEYSNGEYYYFIGDDDRLDFSGLIKVIDAISTKKINQSILVALNPCIKSREKLFENINLGEWCVEKMHLSELQFYYVGNACSFIKTNLCKEFILNNNELASSLPVPQAMCAAYAVIKSGEILKFNVPVLREVSGDNFNNSIISSWSILYTRILIPRYSVLRIANAYNIKLKKMSIFKRHPELKLNNFGGLLFRIAFHYYFIDDNDVRKLLRAEVDKNKVIGIVYKILLKIIISKLFIFTSWYIFRLLYICKLPFALRIQGSIEKNLNIIEESKKNKSKHYWGKGIF